MSGRWRATLILLSGWIAGTAPASGADSRAHAPPPSQQLQHLQDRILEEQLVIRALQERRARLLAHCEEWQGRLTVHQEQLNVLQHAQACRRRAQRTRQTQMRRQALEMARIVAAEKRAQRLQGRRRPEAACALAEAQPQPEFRYATR